MDNYAEANRCYELAIKDSVEHPSFNLLSSYGTNLLALDQYDKFLTLFRAKEDDVNKAIKTKYRFRFLRPWPICLWGSLHNHLNYLSMIYITVR